MNNKVLELRKVSRIYPKAQRPAVSELSFSIEAGQIFALIGINGAGKTTTMKMCSALLEPSSGEIFIQGKSLLKQPELAGRLSGLVLGGERGFYSRASLLDNLKFFSQLKGVDSAEVEELLERVGLLEKAKCKVSELSRGQKQRLHIARALIGKPALLLLDEPTMGLDPDVSLSIRSLIRSLADEGAAILLSSHSMLEVEELSDKIAVIKEGKLQIVGSASEVAHFAGVHRVVSYELPAIESRCFESFSKALAHFNAQGFLGYSLHPAGSRWLLQAFWKAVPGETTAQLAVLLHEHYSADSLEAFERKAQLEDAFLVMSGALQGTGNASAW